MKKMKKFILSLGLIAMAFSLTNCVQNEEATPSVDVKGDFELYAPISRTANNGLNTVWSTGDALNVFHAVTDGTTYTNDGEFKLEDATTSRFLGNVNGTLDPQEEYDWYAFYPYSSYTTTPANTSGGRYYIGCRSDQWQTQNGNDSMAHIAGTNYPMAGYAVAAPGGAAPSLEFTHISSLVEFEVVNKMEEAITVTEIALTAAEDIVGYYYINFTKKNNYTFTKYETFQSNTAVLKVENGSAIAAGASAKFYAAVKPFTAAASSKLAVVVNAKSATGLAGTHDKNITLTDEVVFSSGKMKNVKVYYDTAFEKPAANEVVATLSFASKDNRTVYNSNQQVWEQNGIKLVNDKGSSTTAVADYANPARFYKNSTITITAPGNIKKIEFSAASGYANLTNEATVSGTKITVTPTSQSNTYVAILSVGQLRANSVTVTYVTGGSSEGGETPEVPATPVLSVDSTTLSFDAAEASKTVTCTIENEVDGVNVTATESVDWLTTSVSDKTVTVTASENTTTSTRTATVTIAYTGAEDVIVAVTQNAKPRPSITVGSTLSVEADATTATISYTLSNTDATTVTATADVDWITAIDTTEAGKVKLTLTANTGDARDAKVTLSTPNAASNPVVTVTQKGGNGGGEDITLAFTTFTNKCSDYTTTWVQSCNNYSWNIVNFNNNNGGNNNWTYIKCGRKNNASIASINTKFSIPWAVSSVVVTIDSATASKVNKTYLVVATDANFSNVVETVNVTFKTGTLTYTVTNPGANYYYKLVYDCASGSSNGLVQISKVVYKAE